LEELPDSSRREVIHHVKARFRRRTQPLSPFQALRTASPALGCFDVQFARRRTFSHRPALLSSACSR